MRERVKWIDIVKFFGIFAIYLGHFGEYAGKAGSFVFTYHVALFFFVSGCMENMNTEDNIGRYIKKKVKTILIPCFFFACVTVIIQTLHNGYGLGFIKGSLILIAKGLIRNSFENQSLWFMTCLFSVQMIFVLVKKLRYKPLIILVCVALYYIALELLPVNPMYTPSWPYNVDSALFYMLYYAIGYLIYPYIVRLFVLNTEKKKAFFIVSGVFSIVYTLGLYFGMDLIANIFYPLLGGLFYPVLTTSIIIWAHFVVARLIQNVEIFVEAGKNTLYLCGSEYIIKYLMANLALIIGVEVWTIHPILTYIYVAFLLFITNWCLVPIERYLVDKIARNI